MYRSQQYSSKSGQLGSVNLLEFMHKIAFEMHPSQAAVGTLEQRRPPGCRKRRGLYVSTFAIAPEVTSISTSEAVAREVRTGLTATPKTLSPWLFYDEAGSHLFEEI